MSSHWQSLGTAGRIDAIKAVYTRGASMADLARRLGVSRKAIAGMYCRHRDKLDKQPLRTAHRAPVGGMTYRERRADDIRRGSQGKLAAGLRCMASERIDLDLAAELMAQIPKHDTRSLTGFLMGDPLPERSALAQRTLREVR